MPSLFRVGSYVVYFWSNENNEPVHVHVADGRPSQNATKVWLTRSGGCVLAGNAGSIPEQDLREVLQVIAAQFFWIVAAWKKHFLTDDIRFYC